MSLKTLTGRLLFAGRAGGKLVEAFEAPGMNGADLTGATYDLNTTWPAAIYWGDTTCPDGSNSDDPGNATCGMKV